MGVDWPSVYSLASDNVVSIDDTPECRRNLKELVPEIAGSVHADFRPAGFEENPGSRCLGISSVCCKLNRMQ